MPRPNGDRRDPFWDLDGTGARRSRRRRRVMRAATGGLIAALALALGLALATQLPTMDPAFLRDAGRPLLAAAVLALLGAAVLVGLSRMRQASQTDHRSRS